ncbi:MAG: FtsX-like permease family protein [Gemmatimonadota bacterium]
MFLALIAFVLAPLWQDPGVLIERRLATDLSLSVGDTLGAAPLAGDLAARRFVVAGVFEREADPNRIARNDYEIRFHLPDLEAMLLAHDRVDRFALVLAPGADPERVGRWVESLAFGTQAYEAAALADETSTTFRVVSRFQDAIGLVTLLASGIFLLCLMVIRVDERRSDVRTLRLVGISRGTIVRTVVLEAVVVAGVASGLGIALGSLLTWGVNRYYAAFYDTTLRFAVLTPRIVVLAAGLGIALGVIAGGLAALRLVSVPPQKLGER